MSQKADCSFINAGTYRSDCVFDKGVLTLGDFRKIIPFIDLVVNVEVTGEQLYLALENSVSKFPTFDGRFPSVSGMKFDFDPDREPMDRVDKQSVYIRNRGKLDFKATYKLATINMVA
jgi:5'-nucleotidase